MRVFVYECVCAGGLGLDVPSSLLREGRAMLAAIVEDLQRVADVEVATLIAEEFAYQLGDVCHPTAAGSWSDGDRMFEAIAKDCAATLVIAPEFGGLLAGYSLRVLDAGGRLLGPLPNAIKLTADKLALAEFWRVKGTPHPWTDSLGQGDLARIPMPCVLKPRHGAGSQAIYLTDDVHTASRIAQAEDCEFLVQQYVAGQPASVALLIGKAQMVPLAPARQHLSNDGRFRYEGGSLPLPEQLAQRATRLALQAVAGIDGLQGYVGVDLILGDDGRDFAIEINPRLTTSYLGLRQLCEQNLAELMLRIVQGEKIATPAWKAGEVSFQI